MKKYLIFSILSLIFLFSLPAEAVKTIKVNPFNLAVIIAEKTDSVKIQREFDYYGYTLQGTEDGYKIMKSPQGNEILYSHQSSLYSYPTVIVKIEEDPTKLSRRLFDLNFQKEGNSYTRITERIDNHILHCTPDSSNTLLLQCQEKRYHPSKAPHLS